MDCEEIQVLSVPHIMGDLDPNSTEGFELEAHLVSCRDCAEQYKNTKSVVGFIEQHRAVFAGVFEALEKKRAAEQKSSECNQQDLLQALDKLKAEKRRATQAKSYNIWKIASAAACVAIGIFTWLILSNSEPIETQVPQRLPVAAVPSVKIELLSDNGNVIVPMGMEVRTATNELKTLIIDGKHRLVMNYDTILAVKPMMLNTRLGCAVNLKRGEVFAHVKHDGNPFIVRTAHGQALITGTVFDLMATKTATILVVAEGSVQFESEKGVVKVTAGQTSRIVGQSAPTSPVFCNVAELTAWATDYKSEPTLAQSELNTDPSQLPLSLRKEPIVLEETDYEDWIERQRDWFKREFPWIFQLKDALAKEGIQVDYPQLLIKSGDIWQFAYPEASDNRIPIFDPNSLIALSSQYDRDKLWLQENVRSVRSTLGRLDFNKNRYTGLEAFEKWLNCLKKSPRSAAELDPEVLLYSLHAARYFANTRALMWFETKEGHLVLKPRENTKVLNLLQDQVNVAANLTNLITRLLGASQGQPCEEYYHLTGMIVEQISILMDLEKRLSKHETLR